MYRSRKGQINKLPPEQIQFVPYLHASPFELRRRIYIIPPADGSKPRVSGAHFTICIVVFRLEQGAKSGRGGGKWPVARGVLRGNGTDGGNHAMTHGRLTVEKIGSVGFEWRLKSRGQSQFCRQYLI